MKIIEVINENQNLQEFAFLFTALQKAAIQKLASVWADDIIRAGAAGTKVSFSNPSRIIDRLMAKNPKILQAAKDQAKKIAAKANKEAAVGAAAAGYRTVAEWATIAATVGQFVEMLKPIRSYLDYMSYAEEKLNKGDWQQNQFDAVRQEQMSILIGRLSAILGVKAGMAGFSAFVGVVISRTPLGPAYKALSAATQYLVLNKIINSPEAIKAIATIFTNEYVDTVVGGIGVAAVDFIKGLIPGTDANKKKNDAAAAAKNKPPEAGRSTKPLGPSVKGTAGLGSSGAVSSKDIDPKDLASRGVLRDPSALGGYRYVYERGSK